MKLYVCVIHSQCKKREFYEEMPVLKRQKQGKNGI